MVHLYVTLKYSAKLHRFLEKKRPPMKEALTLNYIMTHYRAITKVAIISENATLSK